MNKLLSVIVAAMFAASSAFVVSPAGAQTKDDKKTEKKAEKAKTAKAKGEATSKPKKEGKATKKQGDAKKKDEMKK